MQGKCIPLSIFITKLSSTETAIKLMNMKISILPIYILQFYFCPHTFSQVNKVTCSVQF